MELKPTWKYIDSAPPTENPTGKIPEAKSETQTTKIPKGIAT